MTWLKFILTIWHVFKRVILASHTKCSTYIVVPGLQKIVTMFGNFWRKMISIRLDNCSLQILKCDRLYCMRFLSLNSLSSHFPSLAFRALPVSRLHTAFTTSTGSTHVYQCRCLVLRQIKYDEFPAPPINHQLSKKENTENEIEDWFNDFLLFGSLNTNKYAHSCEKLITYKNFSIRNTSA